MAYKIYKCVAKNYMQLYDCCFIQFYCVLIGRP
jgi:hypothetical protein